MNMQRIRLTAALVASMALSATAEIVPAAPFADGMVLQRDRPIRIWGEADAGEKVAVAFAGATAETVADIDGRWRVELPAMAASAEGRELRIGGKVLKDVLVGEVWFCCGQSNTEMPLVGGSPHFSERMGRLVAQMTRLEQVRYVYAADYKMSVKPKTRADYPVAWKKFVPENLGTEPSFSALGVYFAIELYHALGIPVGIVGSYWGGTGIDPWTPREGYEGKASLAPEANYKVVKSDDWNNDMRQGPISAAHQQPTVLFNEMVAPWCPMSMRGFIWYQGCANNGSPECLRYATKMHALYDGWSKKFENPGLKLYFVQLAPFNCSWWDLQMQQARFAAEEPNAGMVVSADVGNWDDVHPCDKATLSKRLAAMALARDYGFKDLVADSPAIKGVCSEEGRIVMRFDHANGWYAYDPAWGVDYGFEVAGADGVWHPAFVVNANGGKTEKVSWHTRGEVAGRDLVVASEKVEKPVKVRYLHNPPYVGKMFATSGLPLGPFEAEVK